MRACEGGRGREEKKTPAGRAAACVADCCMDWMGAAVVVLMTGGEVRAPSVMAGALVPTQQRGRWQPDCTDRAATCATCPGW